MSETQIPQGPLKDYLPVGLLDELDASAFRLLQAEIESRLVRRISRDEWADVLDRDPASITQYRNGKYPITSDVALRLRLLHHHIVGE